MGRSYEEVREWVIGRIEQWMSDTDILEEASEHRHLEFIRDHIAHGNMLYKDEAETLKRKLEEELDSRLDNPPSIYSSKILWIDELSIYADAWGYWCRPGTYMILA